MAAKKKLMRGRYFDANQVMGRATTNHFGTWMFTLKDAAWLMGMYRDSTTEIQIAPFVKRCRRYLTRQLTCVKGKYPRITFDEIEELIKRFNEECRFNKRLKKPSQYAQGNLATLKRKMQAYKRMLTQN